MNLRFQYLIKHFPNVLNSVLNQTYSLAQKRMPLLSLTQIGGSFNAYLYRSCMFECEDFFEGKSEASKRATHFG